MAHTDELIKIGRGHGIVDLESYHNTNLASHAKFTQVSLTILILISKDIK